MSNYHINYCAPLTRNRRSGASRGGYVRSPGYWGEFQDRTGVRPGGWRGGHRSLVSHMAMRLVANPDKSPPVNTAGASSARGHSGNAQWRSFSDTSKG